MFIVSVLFMLGILISLVGNTIGMVQSFQESVTWGLLYLFVPFAAIVFTVKFWDRKWVRNSFLLSIGGALLMAIGVAMLSITPGGLEEVIDPPRKSPQSNQTAPFSNAMTPITNE